jgi:hypothetical protein
MRRPSNSRKRSGAWRFSSRGCRLGPASAAAVHDVDVMFGAHSREVGFRAGRVAIWMHRASPRSARAKPMHGLPTAADTEHLGQDGRTLLAAATPQTGWRWFAGGGGTRVPACTTRRGERMFERSALGPARTLG